MHTTSEYRWFQVCPEQDNPIGIRLSGGERWLSLEQWQEIVGELQMAIAHVAAVRAVMSPKSESDHGGAREWQPIASAPRGSGKDGPQSTRHPDYVEPPMLLLRSTDGVVVGYYDWYFHPEFGAGAQEGVPAWRDHNGEPVYGATHWMPLPEVPDLKVESA